MIQNRRHSRVRRMGLLLGAAVALVAGSVARANPAHADITYSGPITISAGGTYSGNWESTDPSTAAVTVTTSDPVTIENSHIQSRGNLIQGAAPSGGIDLTVTNTYGYGLNPDVSGVAPGTFINAPSMSHIDVEHNWIEGVSYGLFLQGYVPGNADPVTIKENVGYNMNGRESDGNGGWLSDHQISHFIIMDGMHDVPGVDISWNQVIDEPFNSVVEDVINIYDSSGTADSPLDIHDNYIDGAYPVNPNTDGYNGGGIITDGFGGESAEEASAYVHIDNNQVISTTNYGIAFASGHDNSATGNTVISSGLLPDGSTIAAQNVGMYCWDAYGNVANGSMYGNSMTGNTIGWLHQDNPTWRNDMWFPDCPQEDYGLNTSVSPDPTLDTESQQYSVWQDKLANNSITVGPSEQPGESVVGVQSGSCLDAFNGNISDGTNVEIWTCNGGANQQWQLQQVSGNTYTLVGAQSGKCLDVANQETGDGANVEIWTCNGGANQQWQLQQVSGNTYTLVGAQSGRCLDVFNGNTTDGTNVDIWTCNGGANQQWQLTL